MQCVWEMLLIVLCICSALLSSCSQWEQTCPRGDIWQGLETIPDATARECYWHLLRVIWDVLNILQHTGDHFPSQARDHPAQTSIVWRWEMLWHWKRNVPWVFCPAVSQLCVTTWLISGHWDVGGKDMPNSEAAPLTGRGVSPPEVTHKLKSPPPSPSEALGWERQKNWGESWPLVVQQRQVNTSVSLREGNRPQLCLSHGHCHSCSYT